MIRNDTEQDFQLCLQVGEEALEGEWRSVASPCYTYEILEKDHRIDQASWGGYIRHNALYRKVYSRLGELVEEQFLFTNDAIMMYSPLLSESKQKDGID